MPRSLAKPRPKRGAHLAALRRRAGLTQAELAKATGQSQQTIAYWEKSEFPPRADVLPHLARVLRVRVEDIINTAATPAPPTSASRMQRLFEEVSLLPRRQQAKVIEFVEAFVHEYKRKVS